jgi:hypothetical protein
VAGRRAGPLTIRRVPRIAGGGNSASPTPEDLAELYDREGILPHLEEEPVEFALGEELREQIRKRPRRRKGSGGSCSTTPDARRERRKPSSRRPATGTGRSYVDSLPPLP